MLSCLDTFLRIQTHTACRFDAFTTCWSDESLYAFQIFILKKVVLNRRPHYSSSVLAESTLVSSCPKTAHRVPKGVTEKLQAISSMGYEHQAYAMTKPSIDATSC